MDIRKFECKPRTAGCEMHYVLQQCIQHNISTNITTDISNGRLWLACRASHFAVHLQEHSSRESVDTSEAASPEIKHCIIVPRGAGPA